MSTIAAVGAWLMTLGLLAAAVGFGLATSGIRVVETQGTLLEAVLVFAPVLIAYATVGALLASLRPRNAIGWILMLTALGGATSISFYGYGVLNRGTTDAALPYVVWFGDEIGSLLLIAPLLVPALFPSGTVRSRIGGAAVVLVLIAAALQLARHFIAGRIGTLAVANPFAIGALGPLLPAVDAIENVALSLTFLASVASLILRYRAGGRIERLQLRWLLYASFFTGAAVAALFIVGDRDPLLANVGFLLFVVGLGLIPVSIAIAIIRYRLFDIDLLINRTLVYGGLTGLLGAAFFGSIVLLQTLLKPFTRESDLAVAGSTLAVAAAAQPLRRGLQRFIDQRFYRRKYDAQQTVAGYAAYLRQEVDLDALAGELLTVARETMQPLSATLWLRRETSR